MTVLPYVRACFVYGSQWPRNTIVSMGVSDTAYSTVSVYRREVVRDEYCSVSKPAAPSSGFHKGRDVDKPMNLGVLGKTAGTSPLL
jgi:hypothetical protein